jgi:chromosomal replication initiator protein
LKKKVKVGYNGKIMSEQNYQAFWNEVLNLIHEEYKAKGQEDEFTLWFNMTYLKDTLTQIIVSVPSKMMWDMMVKKGHVKEIQDKLYEMTGQNVDITYVAKKDFILPSPPAAEMPAEEKKDSPAEQTSESEKNKANAKDFKKHPQLDENFTFDTFVPGENSDYAFRAAWAAAKDPGGGFSPLLIYGGSGMGKTHLMQSIGNHLYNEKKGNIKICYISAENFTNEFTTSIKNITTEKFKTKYRNLDVLLIDDIHFLIGKEGTQEELFHTFEDLHQKKAQIVFTCDRPITELKGMFDRLASRINSGTKVDLQPPNYETRQAILRKELEILNKHIDPEVVDYIAKNVQTNVRELKGCLITMLNYADLMNHPLTLEIAQKRLRDTVSQTSTESVTIDTIQKVVAEYYNISISDMKSRKRPKKVVIPRQIAIYIARKLCDYSYPELGNEFGGKDHTTIMHSYEKVVDQLKIDSVLDSTIEMLIRKIREYKK